MHRGMAQGHVGVSGVVKPAGIVLQNCWGSQTMSSICCFGSSPQRAILLACAWTWYWRELLGGVWLWSGSELAIMYYGCSWFQCLSSLLGLPLFIWVNTCLKVVQKGVSSLQLHPWPGICAALQHALPREPFSSAHGHGSSNENLLVPSQWLNGVQV